MSILSQKEEEYKSNSILPDNPIVFVFIGEYAVHKYNQTRQYFGDMDCVIYIQVLQNDEERILDDDVVVLSIGTDGMPIQDNIYVNAMEMSVRKAKRHKYINHADVDICVIADCGQKFLLNDICKGIYELLSAAYFNHVFFEIYFLFKESLLRETGCNDVNRMMLHQAKELEKQEWVRFVFLVSEMTNKEYLLDDKKQIFQLVLDSVMMGNCSRLRLDKRNCNIYQQLMERTTVTDSKLLTAGRVSLEQSKEEVSQVIRACLLNEIIQIQMERKGTPVTFHMGIDMLRDRISGEINMLMSGINFIACYENVSYNEIGFYTNAEVLYKCFRNNHLEYMKKNKFLYQTICSEITQTFCKTQLNNWLNDNVEYFVNNIFEHDEINRFMDSVCNEIEKYIALTGRELDSWSDELFEWKQKKAEKNSRRLRKKEKYIYPMYIAQKWAQIYVKEFECEIFMKCLQDILYYLESWKSNVCARCLGFYAYQKRTEYQHAILLQDISKVRQYMLVIYERKIQNYFKANNKIVENCYKDLFKHVCVWKEDSGNIADIIEEYVDKIYSNEWEANDLSVILAQVIDKNSFCYELYRRFMDEKLLQIRGSVCNIEPYICFVGDDADEFIQYILENEPGEQIVFASAEYKLPTAVYYQHIDKIEELFMHTIYHE